MIGAMTDALVTDPTPNSWPLRRVFGLARAISHRTC